MVEKNENSSQGKNQNGINPLVDWAASYTEDCLHTLNQAKSHPAVLGWISQTTEVFRKNIRKTALSVGIELEFFLVGPDKVLANAEQAEMFVQNVSKAPGWKMLGSSPAQRSVERWVQGTQSTRLHYEYFPHLLELSTTYFYNLHELAHHLDEILPVLKRCAQSCRLSLMTPLNLSRARGHVPMDPRRYAIDCSRAQFATRVYGNLYPHCRHDDFPAYTASMQVHIGGMDWTEPSLMDSLYEIESSLFLESWEKIAGSQSEAQEAYSKRINFYQTSFPGMSLIGIPPMKHWSLSDWAAQLLLGPCPMNPGKSLLETSSGKPFSKDLDDLSQIRDFQLVRPRLQGTLEFRGEAPTLDKQIILDAAARRLASVVLSQDRSTASSLEASRKKWQHIQQFDEKTLFHQDWKDKLSAALKSRNLGEEIWFLL
jgi:hypothetical protein